MAIIAPHLVDPLLSNFFTKYRPNNEGINSFFGTLSEDFAFRVDTEACSAIGQENLGRMQAGVIASSQAWGASDLDRAAIKVADARSILSVEVQRCSSANIAEEAGAVLLNIHDIEAAMSALQVIAAEDLTILLSKVQAGSTVGSEVGLRADEYSGLAGTLKRAYLNRQFLRTVIKTNKDLKGRKSGVGSERILEKSLYLDGKIQETSRYEGYLPDEAIVDMQEDLQEELASAATALNLRLITEASRHTAGAGNLDEASRIWNGLKEFFPAPAPIETSQWPSKIGYIRIEEPAATPSLLSRIGSALFSCLCGS